VPWLATAFVPGPSLGHLVSTCGPMPVTAVWQLAGGLAEALAAIHAGGVVHRDLKPANVLMAADGPRVIDFGISQARGSAGLTTAGVVLGTPAFMSPEQAQGKAADEASDVFSMGSVLAFAATGTAPFGEDTAVAILNRLVHEPPDLRQVPLPLCDLIGRCLAKNPAERPDLGEVMRAISAAAEGRASAGSFWPEPIGDLIASYRASLDRVTQAAWSPTEAVFPGPPAPGLSPPALQPGPATLPRTARRPTHRAGVAALAVVASAAITVGGIAAYRAFGSSATGSRPQTHGSALPPVATVCQESHPAGCTRGGMYHAPNAIISTSDGGMEVTWNSTTALSYGPGQSYTAGYPLLWIAGIAFRNMTSAPLRLACPGSSAIREYISGGKGDTGGYVAASSTSCDGDQGWPLTVPPGGTVDIVTTFNNVPWPGAKVSLAVTGAGVSPSIYPFT
jgi:hypothetical protein